jgi:hypothetical protein
MSLWRAWDVNFLLKVASLGTEVNPQTCRSDGSLSRRLRSEVTVGILKNCLARAERIIAVSS